MRKGRRHTARLVSELTKRRFSYTLQLYPEERHMPRGAETRAHMEQIVLSFLLKHTAAPPPLELRGPRRSETAALLALAQSTGLFAAGEVDELLAPPLASFHAGTLGAGQALRVAVGGEEVLGWSFGGPQEGSPDCWELLWVGVRPDRHRRGVGSALLAEAMAAGRAAGCARLRVSTSSLPATAAARALYARRGFAHVGGEKDYYGVGDDRVDYEQALR